MPGKITITSFLVEKLDRVIKDGKIQGRSCFEVVSIAFKEGGRGEKKI